jgi:hypothetical protein
VKHLRILGHQHILDKEGLLRGLLRDLVLKEGPQKLKNYRDDVFGPDLVWNDYCLRGRFSEGMG